MKKVKMFNVLFMQMQNLQLNFVQEKWDTYVYNKT